MNTTAFILIVIVLFIYIEELKILQIAETLEHPASYQDGNLIPDEWNGYTEIIV